MKIRMNNQQEFEILTNGIASIDFKITISFLPGEMTLAEIDAIFSDSENTKKIFLLSEHGEELRVYHDYLVLASIEKQMNAIVGQNQAEDGEVLPILGEVIVITLNKIDEISKELASIRADVDYIAMVADVEL